MEEQVNSTSKHIGQHRPAYLAQTASRERKKGEPRWQWEEIREEIRARVNACRREDGFRAYSIPRFNKLLVPYMQAAWSDAEKVRRLVRLRAECVLGERKSVPYSATFHLQMEKAAEGLKPKQLTL